MALLNMYRLHAHEISLGASQEAGEGSIIPVGGNHAPRHSGSREEEIPVGRMAGKVSWSPSCLGRIKTWVIIMSALDMVTVVIKFRHQLSWAKGYQIAGKQDSLRVCVYEHIPGRD